MYREAKLSAPVKDWLERRGLAVYAEVAYYSSPIDLIGADLDVPHIVAVELKTSLTKKVIHQAHISGLCANEIYCGVPTKPRRANLDRCRQLHLGVLYVGDSVRVLTPSFQRPPNEHARKRLIDQLKNIPTGGVGGMPDIKGEGPAQSVFQEVARVRSENPKITWRELYDEIPNHYAGFRSMQVAMGLVKKGRLRRERIEQEKREVGAR